MQALYEGVQRRSSQRHSAELSIQEAQDPLSGHQIQEGAENICAESY